MKKSVTRCDKCTMWQPDKNASATYGVCADTGEESLYFHGVECTAFQQAPKKTVNMPRRPLFSGINVSESALLDPGKKRKFL